MNKFQQKWKESKGWNPFSSEKLFAHIYRWREIEYRKSTPAPVWITVDPTNLCDFDCVWCNSKTVRDKRNTSLSPQILRDLVKFLPRWGTRGWNVEAVTIAGGGEPLLNSAVGEFIERLVGNGIQVGVITNGVHIDRFMGELSKCTWVSVSVDAGGPETHHRLKRTFDKDVFYKVIANISKLADFSKSVGGKLTSENPSYGITYKYLLHPGNIQETFMAAKIAKEIGCKNICYRPAVTPQHRLGTPKEIVFTPEEIGVWDDYMNTARELDDDNFNVYEYTYRVGPMFERNNCFEKCHSIFMSAIVQPPDVDEIGFNLGLCCDRRGDIITELIRNSVNVNLINLLWGGPVHWDIYDQIDHRSQCPQCTHIAHNQVYEQAILNDCLTYRFI
jgi:organic radical activating enzyme